jgi:hypothetical protein
MIARPVVVVILGNQWRGQRPKARPSATDRPGTHVIRGLETGVQGHAHQNSHHRHQSSQNASEQCDSQASVNHAVGCQPRTSRLAGTRRSVHRGAELPWRCPARAEFLLPVLSKNAAGVVGNDPTECRCHLALASAAPDGSETVRRRAVMRCRVAGRTSHMSPAVRRWRERFATG